MKTIFELAKDLNLSEREISPYGWYMGKIDYEKVMKRLKDRKDGKYVLITSALNANAAGEGKTSTEIGLNDALNYLGYKAIACLREPSNGVSFGSKGGATGALEATVVPEDNINHHFTGDLHALTFTINLIAAQIDNIIYQGNELNIDPNKIIWDRAIDICDRSLRDVTVAQSDKKEIPHHSKFVITVAHELSTIATFATSEDDFISKAEKAIVAYTYDNKPVFVKDLKMSKAIRELMHEALKPNLVQSKYGNPIFVSGTPFANISIGTNSALATKIALKLADIVLSESGFGMDLGGEKNLNLVCPKLGIIPQAIVAVCSCRSLKYHAGISKEDLSKENIKAVKEGLINMQQHINHLKYYGIPVLIAINKFSFDTDLELKIITDYLDKEKINYALSEAPLKGPIGSVDLAEKLVSLLQNEVSNYKTIYKPNEDLFTKIEKICKIAYGASNIVYTDEAQKEAEKLIRDGYGNTLGVCISKTNASITDNPKILGKPKIFDIHVRGFKLYNGAGFITALCGPQLLLPGLSKLPRLRDDWKA